MAKIRTTPDNFAKDTLDIFHSYADDVVEAILDETNQTAEEGAKQLRNIRQPEASSSGSARPMKRRQWNKYSKSWGVVVREHIGSYQAIVRNSRHYRLTHLLEKGHATRNGTTTRAFRHIEPVSEYCEERMVTNIPKIIKKGGKL